MPLLQSDSIILKTYPLGEADRIVSFLSRDHGKLRGVANGARRMKNRFGASLEPLAHSRIMMAVNAVFGSWNNPRAIHYRKMNKISDALGTAVNVQAMVFGNMAPDRYYRRERRAEPALRLRELQRCQSPGAVSSMQGPVPQDPFSDTTRILRSESRPRSSSTRAIVRRP